MTYQDEADKIDAESRETLDIIDTLIGGAVQLLHKRVMSSPGRDHAMCRLSEARHWLGMAVGFERDSKLERLGPAPEPEQAKRETDPGLT